MSTGLSYAGLFFCFRISEASISQIVDQTCLAIWEELFPIHMPNPTLDMMEQVSKDFQSLWNLPHCVGVIDGKHISLKKPANTHGEHFNYKRFHSIVLQGNNKI